MVSSPRTYLEKSVKALQQILRLEALGGILLMAAMALAMAVANSPLDRYYTAWLQLPLEIRIGGAGIAKPLLLWINDGLMAVFFLLVGMELKREVCTGHLSTLRGASLPAFAALGGVLVPAAIYAAFNWGDSTALKGWAIPSATDIAFALGVLALSGERVPPALKAFLLSVAIFDDIGAIVVIALFYTAELSFTSLAFAAVFFFGLLALNRLSVTKPAPYFLLGIALWVAVLKSGVHATLAGVALAVCIPLRASDAGSSEPLLERLEHALQPWVAFGILPIFAFANAGVSLKGLSLADLLHPVPVGIVFGLVAGKQIGVMVASGLAVGLGISSLPQGVRWPQLYGASLLCGIGFTMSLFIASLAFEQGGFANLGLERMGIVAGSLISGVAGYLALRFLLDKG